MWNNNHVYLHFFFFLTCGKSAVICGGEVQGWGLLKGEKRRKEAIERGLPGGLGAALTLPLMVFVHKSQALCSVLL